MNDEPSVTLLDEQPERARVQRELRHQLIAAGGLVVVMMLLFWFLGAITGGGTDVEVDDAPAETAAEEDGEATGDEPQADADAAADPSADAAGGAESASGAAGAGGDGPETSVPEPAPTPLVPPEEVSIQVIDGVIDDSGAAMDELSAELSGAGYDVAAEAKSFRRYETTTVFYTQGHAVEGRQVAEMLGLDTVSEKGSNLSSAVDVHVVVGQDRG